MSSANARAKFARREQLLLQRMMGSGAEGQTVVHQLYMEYANPSSDRSVREELYFFVFGHFGVPKPDELDKARHGVRVSPEMFFEEFKRHVLAHWDTTNHPLWVHCLVWGLYGNQNTQMRVNNTLHRLCFAKMEDDYAVDGIVRKKRRYRDAGNGMVYNEDGTMRKKRIFRCSLCGSTKHNKRRCPRTLAANALAAQNASVNTVAAAAAPIAVSAPATAAPTTVHAVAVPPATAETVAASVTPGALQGAAAAAAVAASAAIAAGTATPVVTPASLA